MLKSMYDVNDFVPQLCASLTVFALNSPQLVMQKQHMFQFECVLQTMSHKS